MQKTFKIKQTPDADELELIPSGNSSVAHSFSGDSTNYTCINDPVLSPNDDTDYIYNDANTSKIDRYTMPNHTTETGTINFVRIFTRSKSDTYDASPTSTYKIVCSNGSSHYYSGNMLLSVSYWKYYYTWSDCPWTATTWTWSNVDDLQSGIQSQSPAVAVVDDELIHPMKAGDVTLIDDEIPDADPHWQCVWQDSTSTNVHEQSAGFESDLYHTGSYGQWFKEVDTDSSDSHASVAVDGNYLYTVDGDYLNAFSYTSAGVLTYITKTSDINAFHVWYHGGYIFAACLTAGIKAYTFNGTTLTLKDTYDWGATGYGGRDINCRGCNARGTTPILVFCALGYDGVSGLTFDDASTETFTYRQKRNDGGEYGEWHHGEGLCTDGTYWFSVAAIASYLYAYTWTGGTTISRPDSISITWARNEPACCYDSTNSRIHVSGENSTTGGFTAIGCYNYNGADFSLIGDWGWDGVYSDTSRGCSAHTFGGVTYVCSGRTGSTGQYTVAVFEWDETNDDYILLYKSTRSSSTTKGSCWDTTDDILFTCRPYSNPRLISHLLDIPDRTHTINSVTVYAKARKPIGDDGQIKLQVKSGTTTDVGAAYDLKESDTEWGTYSKEWTVNPDDSAAWAWSDIEDLQIGIELSDDAICCYVWAQVNYDKSSVNPSLRSTQVYAVVNYTGTEVEVELNQPVALDWDSSHTIFKSLFSDDTYGMLDQGLAGKSLSLRGIEPSSESKMEQLKDFKDNGIEISITGLDDGALCTTWLISDFDYKEKGGSTSHHYEWNMKLEKK